MKKLFLGFVASAFVAATAIAPLQAATIEDYDTDCGCCDDVASAGFVPAAGANAASARLTIDGCCAAAFAITEDTIPNQAAFRQLDVNIRGACPNTDADFIIEIGYRTPGGLFQTSEYNCRDIVKKTNGITTLQITPNTPAEDGPNIPLRSNVEFIDFELFANDEECEAHTVNILNAKLTTLTPGQSTVQIIPVAGPASSTCGYDCDEDGDA